MTRKFWWFAFVPVVLLVFLAALLLTDVIPYSIERWSFCPECRCQFVKRYVLSIPVSAREYPGRMTSYWLDNVEPAHKHTWEPHIQDVFFVHHKKDKHADTNYELTSGLDEDAEIAILDSLPTPADRKTLIAKLNRVGLPRDKGAEYGMRCQVYKLHTFYEKKRNRGDWPQILKRMGLAP